MLTLASIFVSPLNSLSTHKDLPAHFMSFDFLHLSAYLALTMHTRIHDDLLSIAKAKIVGRMKIVPKTIYWHIPRAWIGFTLPHFVHSLCFCVSNSLFSRFILE
jgi:hypothetical protein